MELYDLTIAQLLSASTGGHPGVREQLLRFVQHELMLQASFDAAEQDQAAHEIGTQPTSLVHETFFRLVRTKILEPEHRPGFYLAAAHLLRLKVVEAARRQEAARLLEASRTGQVDQTGSQGSVQPEPSTDAEIRRRTTIEMDLIALDQAMNELEAIDRTKAELAELRFFVGLSTLETAAVLGLGAATVEHQLQDARFWLFEHLCESERRARNSRLRASRRLPTAAGNRRDA